MENFAQYILGEKDLIAKMEIEYYLSKKQKIFFDKSVVLKTELTRLFLNYMELDVDKNVVLTASLLCNCKKVDNPQELGKLKTYAKEGADYLRGIGFEKRICKICEEINRYSNSNPREKESDILELVDQYGGMLLDREERIGFKPDEALVLLEYRNLKDMYNRYLEAFITFAKEIENMQMGENVKMGVLRRLTKIHNESTDIKEFIKKLAYDFEPKVDELINKQREEIRDRMINKSNDPNRALFSKETTRKIMGNIGIEKIEANLNED